MGAAVMDKFRFAQELQSRKEKYYRMAYSYVKNEQDALDIVGEAVYKGLRTLGTLRQPDYFDTWMTRITDICSSSTPPLTSPAGVPASPCVRMGRWRFWRCRRKN